jgi:hypothetical protein
VKIEPDDEIYRVNAVWLGPEQFPFPWRATYRAYGLGLVLLVVGVGVMRQLYGVTFWSFAFVLVTTIKLTQIVNRRMGFDRPFTAVLAMAVHEISGPRHSTRTRGIVLAAKSVLSETSDAEQPEDESRSAASRRPRRLARLHRKDSK